MDKTANSSVENLVLGIDVGSVSVATVILEPDGQVAQSMYAFHQGNVSRTLEGMLQNTNFDYIRAVAATDQTPAFIKADFLCDDRVATIAAARQRHAQVGTILHVGGEQFYMLTFDSNGEYTGLRTNTSCASGTGSFLDQQARRLKLSGSAELAEIASSNCGSLPKIASRCAVFAKTDLVHAQQEGLTLPEICDGLCRGLSQNIANTLFKHERVSKPVILCGGVAKNRAVLSHIGEMLGADPVIDEMAHLYGAWGAGLRLLEEHGVWVSYRHDKTDILDRSDFPQTSTCPPLILSQSCCPDFESKQDYEYKPISKDHATSVEVNLYPHLEPNTDCPVYLGMDIGSTSTKAVWLSPEKKVLAGFYTRTAGSPVQALCSLLETMDDLAYQQNISLKVKGAGSTGSGRKFVGKLSGADQILDEITAHARAALELHPQVDTIIEIGGQDSKFTTLKNGRVTFSLMNTVCAAGTGSFLEEQAEKLGIPLADYADRTLGVQSPMTSDRCTVFMERDINYYLSRGHTANEVLAAALHSVRENYLNKVAVENSIGEVVCFQGATAKNRALVAAFEQRLNQPIHVSSFCHLTGALGAALNLVDTQVRDSTFRGLGLYKENIPVRSEICELCSNHCKLTVADMKDGPVGYGFLCGRDYSTQRFVDNNTSGMDLWRLYRKNFPSKNRIQGGNHPVIGLPDTLYMQEDVSMWVDFFNRLGMRTVAGSEIGSYPVNIGQKWTGAEFCAPITAMHGQVAKLAEQADFIFLPYYLENQEKNEPARRQYCYYSQFIPSLTAGINNRAAEKLLSPVIKYLYSEWHKQMELYRAVQKMNENLGFMEIVRAFKQARENKFKARKKWREILDRLFYPGQELSVMLLGRPYTVLDPAMNKNIPRIFATMGIKTFFQDMISQDKLDASSIKPFLNELHWNYGADIIQAAQYVANTPGLYPVLITSFNCSPDSFLRDVFQRLMDSADKPYLILEMDEHGSSVGYETRVEAAIRAFKNHWSREKSLAPVPARINPENTRGLEGKTVMFPNWDPLTCRLLVANLRREGIDARLMEESPEVIKRSMRLNNGQCLPINVIAQEFVDQVQAKDINPESAVLWMAKAQIACNIPLYPYKLKQMISDYGQGMEKSGVYTGTISFSDVSLKATMNAYFAFMFGGLLRRMGCRTRPYERNPGETDQVMETALELMEQAFLGLRDKEAVSREVTQMFKNIETVPRDRIKVAVFGDLYVRDNPVFNQELIKFIETYGGEAITTPYSDYVKMISRVYFKKWFAEGKYLVILGNRAILEAMMRREKTYYRHFHEILQEPLPEYNIKPERILSQFGVIPENNGESMDNLLKIYYLLKHHPEVSLFVQTSPSFCCPSMVTQAMGKTIEKRTGVPIVSITYDGTSRDKNRKIIPYLKFSSPQLSNLGPNKADSYFLA